MADKMDMLMKQLNKEAKEEIMSKGALQYNYNRIPFTSPMMNYCLYGGLPEGKLIEFFGVEHGGKTTSALDAVANFQMMEKKKAEEDPKYSERAAFYVDIENSLDGVWATKLGVDLDTMYLLQPKEESAEQVFNYIEDAIATGEIGLFVLDSIAAMVSQDEYEKDYEKKSMAGISGPLSRFAKKVEMLCAKYKCTGIGINQVRDDMNSMWGGYKTPGGRAWKHMCSVRLEFRAGKYIDDKGNELTRGAESPAGMIVQMTMVKNKTCMPDRRLGSYTIRYATGIDYFADLIEVALRYGIIVKSGAWFQIYDFEKEEYISEKIQGQNGVYTYLDENEDMLRRVEELIDLKIL